MSILIRNGRIITADANIVADVFVQHETITAIGPNLSQPADRIINATSKYVIPGGIDVHTHLDMPLGDITSTDDFETGTIAAAFGGTTTIIDFPTQTKGQSLHEALNCWRGKAEGKACIDYGFHMIVTDLPDTRLHEMDELVDEGVTTFKLFMAYPGVLMLDDATIYKAMCQAKTNGGLVMIHAEDGIAIHGLIQKAIAEGKTEPKYHALTRPPEMETSAIRRTIALAEKAGVPVYIVHVSSADGLREIQAAQQRGLPVYGETCSQYLFLSLDDISKPNFEGAKYVFTPPVREKWHQEKLWDGLRDNSLQIVSTDHCPFNFKGQKDLGRNDFRKIPNGGGSIENRMQLVFDGGVNTKRISPNRFVEITSTSPAKMFGMYPKKGTIAVGSDADIVIWDPIAEHTISAQTHHMRVDYSMYEGMKVKGNAQVALLRGEVIVENGKWIGKRGCGKFLRRQCLNSLQR
jgi:dihydropyrimidinase